MNKKNLIIIFCHFIILQQFFQSTQASQYNPNVYYSRPSSDDPFASNASMTFSAGFANEAYNRKGKTVPFLEQYGPENFLERFVNPSLGLNNTDSAGQGSISGQYHFKQFRFSYSQNISHKLFFGAVMSLQDISITNITPQFLASELPLSSDQVTYLEQLRQIIPTTIHQSGMYNTNFYFGYSERLTHFNHIDYFKGMLLVDLSTPQSMSNNNTSIFQFPCASNYFFGYPVVGAIEVGVNDIFKFGLSGVVVPFQPASMTIPTNSPPTNNHLLFSQSTRAEIKQEPFFSGSIYTVIEHPDRHYSGVIAYSYTQSLRSHITPTVIPQSANFYSARSILVDGFSLGAFLVELDIDCSSEHRMVAPIVSIFFSMPVVGKLYRKTYLFGGNCNLKISYEF